MLLALSGMLPRSQGTVTVDGVELAGGKPRKSARAGIVLVPDDRALFKTLPVTENLKLAANDKKRVYEVLDRFPGLMARLKVHARDISAGEHKMRPQRPAKPHTPPTNKKQPEQERAE